MCTVSKRYYLAGPMSGIPQCNFPAFYAAAGELRAAGYDIVSPAELDDEHDAAQALASADGSTSQRRWGDFLARDVKLLAGGDITGIVFLPGWEQSRGARLEATVGLLCGFEFELWQPDEGRAVPISRHSVACALHREFTK